MEKEFWGIYKSKISLLISSKENEAWEIIHEAKNKNSDCSAHIVNYVEQLIVSYVYVSNMIGYQLPYNNTKEFFCYCNPDGVDEYNDFNQNAEDKHRDILCEDKLIFLLRHTEGEICKFIINVLNDNDDDPHFSAVYSSNMIKCLVDVSSAVGHSLLYNDIYGFFITHGFCLDQYHIFENKRKIESDYYLGVQY